MGTILSSRMKEDGKVVFEVLVDYDEALQMRGNLNNVHLFSADTADIKTKMTKRGKNESTTYFLVPRTLRRNIKMSKDAYCQKIETPMNTIFLYVIDKLGLK